MLNLVENLFSFDTAEATFWYTQTHKSTINHPITAEPVLADPYLILVDWPADTKHYPHITASFLYDLLQHIDAAPTPFIIMNSYFSPIMYFYVQLFVWSLELEMRE